MLVQLVFVTLKTFKNLRIYEVFSPLVQMLKRVIIDLRFFLFMFFINISFFTLVLSVLQNKESKNYIFLPHIMGNFFDSLRCSIGNFEVIKRVKNETESSVLFWLCWTIIVVVQVMIFMNFIIADTTASYIKIKKRLAEII
jgi:hypothetical protein